MIVTRSKTSVYGLTTDLTNLATADITESNARIAGDAAIQLELDKTQTGAGLGTNGGYIVQSGANYISAAVSLQDADSKLDAAIKTADDRAKSVEGSLSGLSTSVKTDLVSAINSLKSSVETSIDTIKNNSVSRDDALDARLDIIEGDATTAGSIAKALSDAKVYADGLNGTASSSISGLTDRLDVLEGDSTVEGSVAKAIADVVGAAPEALNTLKEIADFLDTNPEADPLSGLMQVVKDAKDELKGSVTTAFDTLGEIEDALNVINGVGAGSIAKTLVDAKAYTDAAKSTIESAASTEHSARVAEEARIEGKVNREIVDRGSEISRVEGLIVGAEGRSLAKSANLSDVANVATARTNLSVYSKSETDVAIRTGGAVFITEVLSVTADKIVTTYVPKNGMVFNFATVRHTDESFVSYDIPVITTGGSDGKEFQLYPNSTGQFDGKDVIIQYAYTAEA